jgi:tagatose-1,6-bisphosphate aldolase non-catalytic subunit AgaZ/GatZ
MIHAKVKDYISKNCCTLLGVGPMSINCVDAVIDLANEYVIPLMLIASRRQIDSEQFNGGYVNNWTTSKFANYVKTKDKNTNIILSRDHGGPWQNNEEIKQNLNLDLAMKSAKESYKEDIDAGFKILHIDTSIDIHKTPSQNEVLERLFELYEYCWSYALDKRKEIIFEIGTEEQSGSTNTPDELDFTLSSMEKFCKKKKFPFPTFVVIQTGTRVMEMRNVGSFDSPLRVFNEIPSEIQVPKMIEICKKHNIFMKEHNTDYLSDTALSWHPRLGIHAANVAPEFGVAETRAFLKIMEDNNLRSQANKFLELAYNSKKWDKWMLPNTTASDRDRSIISGHYIFSTPECLELKKEVSQYLKSKRIDLDSYLYNQVKKSIFRYLDCFRLARTS